MTKWEKMAINSIKEVQKKYFTDNTPKAKHKRKGGNDWGGRIS